MKEICSLMAPFHAYGGKRRSWRFVSGAKKKASAVEKAKVNGWGVVSCFLTVSRWLILGCAH